LTELTLRAGGRRAADAVHAVVGGALLRKSATVAVRKARAAGARSDSAELTLGTFGHGAAHAVDAEAGDTLAAGRTRSVRPRVVKRLAGSTQARIAKLIEDVAATVAADAVELIAGAGCTLGVGSAARPVRQARARWRWGLGRARLRCRRRRRFRRREVRRLGYGYRRSRRGLGRACRLCRSCDGSRLCAAVVVTTGGKADQNGNTGRQTRSREIASLHSRHSRGPEDPGFVWSSGSGQIGLLRSRSTRPMALLREKP
jgi:hypothetical protein